MDNEKATEKSTEKATDDKWQSQRIGRYLVVCNRQYSEIVTSEKIIELFEGLRGGESAEDVEPPDVEQSVIEQQVIKQQVIKQLGRGAVAELKLGDGRLAIMRRYRRGGMVQRISSRFYFRGIGDYRPLQELAVLGSLHDSGVAVPEPLAAVVKPRCFGLCYEAAIITMKVPSTNLLEFVRSDCSKDEIASSCEAAGRVARKMLEHGVFHPDLHLGNVLRAEDGSVVIIDFDRASCFYSQQLPFYTGRTIQRWDRAANKRGGKRASLVRKHFQQGVLA